MKNWLIFIKERFDPLSHLIMIILFITAHYLLARSLGLVQITYFSLLPLFIGVTLFYFKLRLYDEVKDYELDVIINKTRPLPRGLVSHEGMYRGMAFCILVELICFGILGKHAIVAITIPILYSLLMYKEFFIREKIRPHLTTYAMLHTIVTTFLSLAIFCFISNTGFELIVQNKDFLYFAIINWFLFNIFEFGRKTFASSEERENVDTYSSLFGRSGATILVVSQIIIATFLSYKIESINHTKAFYALFAILLFFVVVGISYIITDKPKMAKIFRTGSEVYIILFYIIFTIGLL